MITLITGTPGSGKTLYAVTKILQYVKENEKLLREGKEPRMIYANIDGLNIPGVEPAPHDWRDTPDGSVIFYDEIQQLEPYKKSRYDNEICDGLQVHRHTGHDIFGITQFPVLLHPNFRAVVGLHVHLHRGWGLSSATIFTWAYCVDSPNAPSNKKLAEHTERFQYDKSVYKYYKSATIHTHKGRIPKKFFLVILVVLLFGYFAVKMLFFKQNFFSKVYGYDTKDDSQQVAPETNSNSTLSVSVQSQSDNNTNTNDNQPQNIQTKLENRYIYLYEKDLPEDYIIRRQEPMLQVRGVVQKGNKCTAYNAYGDVMTLSIQECKEYVNTGRVYRSDMSISSGYDNQYYNPVFDDTPNQDLQSDDTIKQSQTPSASTIDNPF